LQPLVSTRELAIVWPFIHEQIDHSWELDGCGFPV